MKPAEQPQSSPATPFICENCAVEARGKFCFNCGQKRLDGRFTLKKTLMGFFQTLVNIDRGLWHTVIDLSLRPDKVLKRVLNGATVAYFHPFRYLFLWVTLYTLVFYSLIDMESFQMQISGVDRPMPPFMVKIVHAINSNTNIITAISIPWMALVFWWLFGRRRYHYGEQLIILCYVYGHAMFISVVLSVLYLFGQEYALYAAAINTLLYLAYMVYALLKFSRLPTWEVVLKTLAGFFGWFAGVIVFLAVVMILYTLVAIKKDPSKLEQFKPSLEQTSESPTK